MTVEELRDLGMEELTADDIKAFLASQGMGVLALPAEEVPYVIPMSFGYDGDRRLSFTFVGSDGSRKVSLSEPGSPARFLVFSAESAFTWRSVVLTGTIDEVPRTEWDDHTAAMDDNAWHPDLLRTALATQKIRVYAFDIEEWSGIRHAGLPPGFDPDD